MSRGGWLALGLVLLGTLPALEVGLFADDLWWVLGLEGGAGVGPYSVNFAQAQSWWGARGLGFWWSPPDLRWEMARPLTALALRAQWALWGASPGGWQAVNLLAHLGLVALAGVLYARRLRPAEAGLATALFGLHLAHIPVVWFVSNLHAPLGAIPALSGAMAWLRWREQGWRPGRWLGPLGVGLGLGFGELALGSIGYLLAWELRFGRDRGPLVGWSAAGLVYVAGHTALGYGVHGSALYLDPRGDPAGFAWGLLTRGPVLAGAALGLVPADLWIAAPGLGAGLAVAGTAGSLAVGALAWRGWAGLQPELRRALGWLVPGAALSLLPGVAAPPGGRLVLWATLGAAALNAALLVQGLEAARKRRWARALGAAPLGLLALGGALATPAQLRGMARSSEELRAAALASELGGDSLAREQVLVLHTPDVWTALYLLPTRLVQTGGPAPQGFTVLSCAPGAHQLERPQAGTLVLTALEGRMWEQPFERLFLAPDTRSQPGATFTRGPVHARVLAADAGAPVRVEFTFSTPPEGPGWRVLTWQDGALRQVGLPPVGAVWRLEAGRSPMQRGLQVASEPVRGP